MPSGLFVQRLYFGETTNLHRRLAGNYRRPGPTQRTSLRINALLSGHLAQGGSVEVATAVNAAVYLAGIPEPLDLARKAARLLGENAALVAAYADANAEIGNFE